MQNGSMIENCDSEYAKLGVAYFKALLHRLYVGNEVNKEKNPIWVRRLLIEIET
jgi:hypothetical protein